MEQGTIITKQMMEFHKTTFDNTFNAMDILQGQTDKMMNMFFDQAPWLPAEGKQAVNEWVKTFQKGREAFKESIGGSMVMFQEQAEKIVSMFSDQAPWFKQAASAWAKTDKKDRVSASQESVSESDEKVGEVFGNIEKIAAKPKVSR